MLRAAVQSVGNCSFLPSPPPLSCSFLLIPQLAPVSHTLACSLSSSLPCSRSSGLEGGTYVIYNAHRTWLRTTSTPESRHSLLKHYALMLQRPTLVLCCLSLTLSTLSRSLLVLSRSLSQSTCLSIYPSSTVLRVPRPCLQPFPSVFPGCRGRLSVPGAVHVRVSPCQLRRMPPQ